MFACSATRLAPVSSGMPRRIDEYVIPLPFNDIERLEDHRRPLRHHRASSSSR